MGPGRSRGPISLWQRSEVTGTGIVIEGKRILTNAHVVAYAGEVQVHFGKNKGVALSSLGERSVAWYAQEPEPRLGNNGKPFPPRPEDVLLRNAARTIIHQKRGTLPSAAVPTAPVANIDEGNVPF